MSSEAASQGVVPRWFHDPRLAVASRALAAAVGGYVLATVSSMWFAQAMPLPTVHAALAGLLLSPIVYTGAVMWTFAARTASRAWLGLLISALVCASLVAATRLVK